MSDLAPQTYHYKVNGAICSANNVRTLTGTISIVAGSSITKTVTLKQ